MNKPVDEVALTPKQSRDITRAVRVIEGALGASVAGLTMVDKYGRAFVVPGPGYEDALITFMCSVDWNRQRLIWKEFTL